MNENPRLPFLREKTAKLTSSPGVYLMKNDRAEIIYIGKAKHLKNRVSGYFRTAAEHPPKVARMVSQVYDYDFIVTDSEYEALVLECSLIKQHQPKYNILLKDDKGYCYLCFSKEPYPRLTAERNKSKPGDYLGPYMSGFVARETAAEVNRIFRLPTCRKKFPQECNKTRPCLNFYIQQCMGVCRGTISECEYAAIIQQAKEYVQTGSVDAVNQMRAEMEDAAARLDFEKAAILRDRIAAVTKAGEKQKILDAPFPEADVITLADNGDMQCVSLLCYRQNCLFDKKAFFFTESVSREELLASFLTQFYGQHRESVPSQILLEFALPNQDMIQQFLSEISGTAVHLFVPQRGEKRKYVKLSVQNAMEEIALRGNQKVREVRALEELGNVLSLPKPPRIIEAYDVSNLSSDGIVCGMVVFVQGKPQKKLYRHFPIRDRVKPDDCACIAEALTRRLRAYTDGQDAAFSQLPDLILLDGGKGQVHAGKSVLAQFPYEIPLYGMVKDSKHRTRAIATGDGEISLSSTGAAFQLLTQIQEEVHRYSISWMRRTHEKSSYVSILTQVRGIGEKKAQKLLLFYHTIDKMREAPITELAKVAGVSIQIAESLHRLLPGISDEKNEKN